MWAAAKLEPRKERLALYTLGLAGFEVYLPRVAEKRTVRGRRITVTASLFVGYAFVVIEHQWHAARWSPGVNGLVMDGIVPARVPDNVITEIRAREVDGVVTLPPPLDPERIRVGAHLRVVGGPLKHCAGLCVGMSGTERTLVLLQLLGARRQVSVKTSDVAVMR